MPQYRKSIRLKGFDYSETGEYYVTICTFDRGDLFGVIRQGKMVENPFGTIVRNCWNDLPIHYPHVLLDAFIVMPNHIHGIIVIVNQAVVAGLRPATTTIRHPLSEIVRALKSFSGRRINDLRGTPGCHVWQRSYFDHIIRDVRSLERIREYIQTNPQHWCGGEHDPIEGRIDNLGSLSQD